MADRNSEQYPIVTAEEMRQETVRKWGHVAHRLKSDAAIIMALVTHIELGFVREDPTWDAAKIHEAVNKARELLR